MCFVLSVENKDLGHSSPGAYYSEQIKRGAFGRGAF